MIQIQKKNKQNQINFLKQISTDFDHNLCLERERELFINFQNVHKYSFNLIKFW